MLIFNNILIVDLADNRIGRNSDSKSFKHKFKVSQVSKLTKICNDGLNRFIYNIIID